MHVWVDGELLADPEVPVLRADDRGFTVGDGVFEAVRVEDGVPFALTRHLTRFAAGATKLGLSAPDPEVVREGVAAVLAAEHLPLGRLRITWSAGPAPMGPGRSVGTPTLVVMAAPMTAYPDSVAVARVPWVRNERSPVAGVKTISYADNVVALARAHERGAAEAVLGNTLGNVCEGTGSNIGYVVDGRARTPSLASGCLPGVTRALMLEWCDVVEADESMAVLEEATEVFLISTTRQIQPVHALDDRQFEVPGPVTAAVMKDWAAGVARGTDP